MNIFAVLILNYTINILILAKNLGKTASYPGLSYLVAGRNSIFFLNFMIILLLDGAVIAYFVLIGDVYPQLIIDIFNTDNEIATSLIIYT